MAAWTSQRLAAGEALRAALIVSASWALLACSSGPSGVVDASREGHLREQASTLFRDASFAPPEHPVDVADILRLDERMDSFVRHHLAASARQGEGPQALMDALQARGGLLVDYDASFTRNARETFAARQGNCLSLALMTGALAKRLGLPVQYQLVNTAPLWNHGRRYAFLVRHVNVRLDPGTGNVGVRGDLWSQRMASLTIDFVPPGSVRDGRVQVLSEEAVLAMYMNNRAAETMDEGKPDEAYAWARAAVWTDPTQASNYNTLAILLRQRGELTAAREAWMAAQRLAPDDVSVLSNLAALLDAQGEHDGAVALRNRVAVLMPVQPFAALEAGLEALNRGDARTAVQAFRRQLSVNEDDAQTHFYLALAHCRLGEWVEAQQQLALAERDSLSASERLRFSGKLMALRAQASAR